MPTVSAPEVLPAAPTAVKGSVSRPEKSGPAPASFGADRDPDNDDVVAPPDVNPECHAKLHELGVTFTPTELPLRQKRGGVFTCGAEDVVVYHRGPEGMRFRPEPVVTCTMAVALARLEALVSTHSEHTLGSRVVSIGQMGTYSCRKMSAYPTLVSEHSYANAIDLDRFVLADGRQITVARHFGNLDAEPSSPEADFLRELARALYDEDVFSVVLTPYFDRHHADHFHLDLARYRVDGTRR